MGEGHTARPACGCCGCWLLGLLPPPPPLLSGTLLWPLLPTWRLPLRSPLPLPVARSVMLRHEASAGLEQVAALMAEGKLKAHLDRCAGTCIGILQV